MEGLTRRDLESLRDAMMRGTARRPLAPPPGLLSPIAGTADSSDPTLPILALVGQHLRFQRPPAAVLHDLPDAALRMHVDSRPTLPKHVGRLLMRLLDGVPKHLAATVIRLAKRRIAAAGFRLHPFDLPRLVPILKGDPDALDQAERAYLLLSEAPDLSKLSEGLQGEVTAENWTEAAKMERRAFLVRERSRDPGAARALLEKAFPSEPAAVRSDLLAAFSVGLGPEDRSFLESASSDRAESVRKVATSLLARLPSWPYAERLTAAARCFRRGTGVTSKFLSLVGVATTASLAFEFPAYGSANERWGALINRFAGLSLPDLVSAVGAPAEAILDVLPAEPEIFWGMHTRAVEDGDAATLTILTRWRLTSGNVYPLPETLIRLALASPPPMPQDAVATVFSSTAWTEGLRARFPYMGTTFMPDDGTLVFTAAMLAAIAIPDFLAAISSLSPDTTRPARAFADLVTALDRATSTPSEIQTSERKDIGP